MVFDEQRFDFYRGQTSSLKGNGDTTDRLGRKLDASFQKLAESFDRFVVSTRCSRKFQAGESRPTRVLHVSIQEPVELITEEVLRKVFSQTGKVDQILILSSSPSVEILVQYELSVGAIMAWDQFHGRNIYDGCNLMDVQFASMDCIPLCWSSYANKSMHSTCLTNCLSTKEASSRVLLVTVYQEMHPEKMLQQVLSDHGIVELVILRRYPNVQVLIQFPTKIDASIAKFSLDVHDMCKEGCKIATQCSLLDCLHDKHDIENPGQSVNKETALTQTCDHATRKRALQSSSSAKASDRAITSSNLKFPEGKEGCHIVQKDRLGEVISSLQSENVMDMGKFVIPVGERNQGIYGLPENYPDHGKKDNTTRSKTVNTLVGAQTDGSGDEVSLELASSTRTEVQNYVLVPMSEKFVKSPTTRMEMVDSCEDVTGGTFSQEADRFGSKTLSKFSQLGKLLYRDINLLNGDLVWDDFLIDGSATMNFSGCLRELKFRIKIDDLFDYTMAASKNFHNFQNGVWFRGPNPGGTGEGSLFTPSWQRLLESCNIYNYRLGTIILIMKGKVELNNGNTQLVCNYEHSAIFRFMSSLFPLKCLKCSETDDYLLRFPHTTLVSLMFEAETVTSVGKFTSNLNWVIHKGNFLKITPQSHVEETESSFSRTSSERGGLLIVTKITISDFFEIWHMSRTNLCSGCDRSMCVAANSWSKLSYKILKDKIISQISSDICEINALKVSENVTIEVDWQMHWFRKREEPKWIKCVIMSGGSCKHLSLWNEKLLGGYWKVEKVFTIRFPEGTTYTSSTSLSSWRSCKSFSVLFNEALWKMQLNTWGYWTVNIVKESISNISSKTELVKISVSCVSPYILDFEDKQLTSLTVTTYELCTCEFHHQAQVMKQVSYAIFSQYVLRFKWKILSANTLDGKGKISFKGMMQYNSLWGTQLEDLSLMENVKLVNAEVKWLVYLITGCLEVTCNFLKHELVLLGVLMSITITMRTTRSCDASQYKAAFHFEVCISLSVVKEFCEIVPIHIGTMHKSPVCVVGSLFHCSYTSDTHGCTFRWITDGQLCPTVPNPSNYILWIEDLLSSNIILNNNAHREVVRGFDIGTGANCIYPLLGESLLGWSFVGSDMTDVGIEWAEKNVKNNPHISDLIEISKVDCKKTSNEEETCSEAYINKGSSTLPREIEACKEEASQLSPLNSNPGGNNSSQGLHLHSYLAVTGHHFCSTIHNHRWMGPWERFKSSSKCYIKKWTFFFVLQHVAYVNLHP